LNGHASFFVGSAEPLILFFGGVIFAWLCRFVVRLRVMDLLSAVVCGLRQHFILAITLRVLKFELNLTKNYSEKKSAEHNS